MLSVWNLKRFIRRYLGKFSLWHILRYYLQRKNVYKVIQRYNGSVDDIKLIKKAWVKYHWNFEEFYMYGYKKYSPEKIASFVPEYEKNVFCDYANNHVSDMVFHDKWETYQRFQPFFKRDAILINNAESLNTPQSISFLNKHTRFIVKPINAAMGQGIRILNRSDYKDINSTLQQVINEVKSACILEELIVQSDTMAGLHPSSVNTLRMPTFRFDDSDTMIFRPFLRIGKGGSVVDNAGAGGIMGYIDVNTGEVYIAGDESNNYYTHHPDTGMPIVGFKIPMWEEAKQFARQLADVLPDVRYVGWDIALTDTGWVLVEGNEKGQFVWQITTQEGFREEYNAICNKAGIRL